MLHFRHIQFLVIALLALPLLPAGASNHFFPRLKPLFVGLDESRVPASAKIALAQAKVDFQLARNGDVPRYAHAAGIIPYTHSQVFQGRGYQVTLVNKDLVHLLLKGPEIVLDASITRDAPYRYDEIDRVEE